MLFKNYTNMPSVVATKKQGIFQYLTDFTSDSVWSVKVKNNHIKISKWP